MYDLSHELYSGMPIYPGDPEVTIGPALTIENDAVLVQHVSMGSHSGTHLDAPAHTVPGGRTLNQIGLSELQGEALILRPKVQAQQAITPTDLGLQQLTSVPQIVVIATGWSEHLRVRTSTSTIHIFPLKRRRSYGNWVCDCLRSMC